jgi:hypothetical protein
VPAYACYTVRAFLATTNPSVLSQLHSRYAADRFVSQYTQQTLAWEQFLPLFRTELQRLTEGHPQAESWGVLLEYPLYRLRKRIDAIVLARGTILVVEAKIREDTFRAEDARQVEDYALDLRDFHAGSRGLPLVPVLWCTDAQATPGESEPTADFVAPVCRVGSSGLASVLSRYASSPAIGIDPWQWDEASYRPVPTIIQAATSIFAGHDVRALARADATNLADSARRVVEIVSELKHESRRAVIFLTGVPGSGKTLAGLEVVHDAVATGAEQRGDIVYLSGNTPLVVVLREALARDLVKRVRPDGNRVTSEKARRDVGTRIQHINDFLKQYLTGGTNQPPHEHAIVYDEAQRAWNADQGAKKFNRSKSEPSLLLEIMGRHTDWCACICLIGGGQEINTGEEGIRGWGDALKALPTVEHSAWTIYGPDDAFRGGDSTAGLALGDLPSGLATKREELLRLSVPLRSYRSPALSSWVSAVLGADVIAARAHAQDLAEYPLFLTRSLVRAKEWLREKGRGERRYGLLASSGARRLRADGLGVILGAGDGDAIAHWYLNGRGDIRSSFFLEVPANEYACQGLEIDHAGLCWGGDLIFDGVSCGWRCRQLKGSDWNEVRNDEGRRFILNSYRVLLTRAREGLVLWVPTGDAFDPTQG